MWKRQPAGGLIGLGTSPLRMIRRRAAPGCGTGTADSSALRVGVLRAPRRSAACGASSTILPRYITATRWVMCSTMARSWLMNSSARPSSRCRSCSRLTICALTDTSSAETASSHTMRSGSAASARAMPMRWRWPPENSWGQRRGGVARQPDLVEQRVDPRRQVGGRPGEAEIADRLGEDVAHPHARIEARERVLEHHLHAPAQRPQRRRPA